MNSASVATHSPEKISTCENNMACAIPKFPNHQPHMSVPGSKSSSIIGKLCVLSPFHSFPLSPSLSFSSYLSRWEIFFICIFSKKILESSSKGNTDRKERKRERERDATAKRQGQWKTLFGTTILATAYSHFFSCEIPMVYCAWYGMGLGTLEWCSAVGVLSKSLFPEITAQCMM